MNVKNRRNCDRILQVQLDAAADVINASYRTLMQNLKFHPRFGRRQLERQRHQRGLPRAVE